MLMCKLISAISVLIKITMADNATMDSSGAQSRSTYNYDLEQARITQKQRALAQSLLKHSNPQARWCQVGVLAPRGGAWLLASTR